MRSRERCIAIVRRGIQRREDTILSAVDKREGEFSRAENETGGGEKEREGGGKKSRKEGNTDKRLLKRNYAGRTRAKKRSNK